MGTCPWELGHEDRPTKTAMGDGATGTATERLETRALVTDEGSTLVEKSTREG